MPDNKSQRCDLGKFLRSRRERIDPSTVGLPTDRRRRKPGLRREEVAVLAGLSTSWYAYLEQGRDINPSPEVLDSLARVLQLSEDERGYLHLLAYGRRPLTAPASQPHDYDLLWEIVRAFRSPYPVYARNMQLDVLAWNDATEEWYTDFGKFPRQHRNVAWWMLVEPEARERFVNWEENAWYIVGRLRAASATMLGDRRLTCLITELSNVSPEFGAWWPDYPVCSQRPNTWSLRHPTLGVQAMQVVVVRPVWADNFAVVLHLPVSDVVDD
ncbi:MAG TPA: helix-turn-helix transcriptional regulator [Amycolatopsis sp.]|uniref:helix-turn-helix transcriptional regulator n=1 Tax=Amycolatopsis sp. TaxID=37632 RepID=UPI002B47CFEC|nr:helix-turn-helix transcriptional regulator [Amycolatopsis sp.]HKS48932.1 helix-turn-helix transcriptional regulator [Amycolatopsis sp.]